MVKDTCKKEQCPWWQQHESNCPMYMTTVWENSEEAGATKIIEDCAPKRNTLLLMEYSARAVGMQQDYEQQRNKYDKLIRNLSEIIIEMEKRNDSTQLIE